MTVYAICADDRFYWDEKSKSWVSSDEKYTISFDKNELYPLCGPDREAYITDLPNGDVWSNIEIKKVGDINIW